MYGPYFVIKLSCLAASVSHDDVIAGLKVARGAIEQSSDSWSKVLIWSTAVVAAGVVLEIVAEAMEVRKELREGKKLEKFHLIAFVAAAIVALFVAIEGVAELKVASKETDLRKNNSDEQLELQASANEAKATADKATSDDVALAKRVGGLDALVAQTNGKLDKVRASASAQKERSDAIIASLTEKEGQVTALLNDAQKDEDALRASADTIRDLRQQIHDFTANRTIDVRRVAGKIEVFAKTPVVLGVSDDNDAINLASLVGRALELAHWDWRDNKPSDNSMEFVKRLTGRPQMRVYVLRGVAVMYAEADKAALEAAAEALANAFVQEQLKYVQIYVLKPEDIEFNHFLTGVVHVTLGTRQ